METGENRTPRPEKGLPEVLQACPALILVRRAVAGTTPPHRADSLRRPVSASNRSTPANRRRTTARRREACGRRHCVSYAARANSRSPVKRLPPVLRGNGTSTCTSGSRFTVEAFRPQCCLQYTRSNLILGFRFDASVQHMDGAVRGLGDAGIVRDQYQCHALLALDVLEQLDHL